MWKHIVCPYSVQATENSFEYNSASLSLLLTPRAAETHSCLSAAETRRCLSAAEGKAWHAQQTDATAAAARAAAVHADSLQHRQQSLPKQQQQQQFAVCSNVSSP